VLNNHNVDLVSRDSHALTPIHYAAMFGNVSVLKWFWGLGLSIETKSFSFLVQSGISPLHLASQFGHEDVVAFLLAIGVDRNVQTGEGVLFEDISHHSTLLQNRASWPWSDF
jgi:ankyrin repeat protein